MESRKRQRSKSKSNGNHHPSRRSCLVWIILPVLLPATHAWQKWNYTNFPTDDWRDIHGYAHGPRGRHGHSMVVFNDTAVVMFGGRSNDRHVPHVARTYEMMEDNGVFTFETYEDKPLLEEYAGDNDDDEFCRPDKTCVPLVNASSGNSEACSYSWHHLMSDDDDDNADDYNHNDKKTNTGDSSMPMPKSMSAKEKVQMEKVCGFTTSGLFFNDVWIYDLHCERSERYKNSDLPCEDDGWRILHPGKRYGGCQDVDDNDNVDEASDNDDDDDGDSSNLNLTGRRKCETPSERWGHSAAMMNDTTMLIYGGYSQECEDYCSDVWTFDLLKLQWERLSIDADPIGIGTGRETETDDEIDPDESILLDNAYTSSIGPGRRWKFSMISVSNTTTTMQDQDRSSKSTPSESADDDHNDNSNDDDQHKSTQNSIIVFGGHRLWHGFADDNSEENLWENVDKFPKGGYLSDLWILEQTQRKKNDTYTIAEWSWTWTEVMPKEVCVSNPGIAWEDRNRVLCRIFWPRERSGHAVSYDKERNRMWVHGGYTAKYPYPSSTSAGSDVGVKGRREKGSTPFASHSFYLDDLWYYDIESGFWKEIIPIDNVFPKMRTDHLMINSGNILILNGGYSDNKYFNDTWYYYIDENKWLEKTEHVHAHFPSDCTDDVDEVKNDDQCIELDFPLPLQRSSEIGYNIGYQEILPFQQQPGYTPDDQHPLYFGIVFDADIFLSSLRDKYETDAEYDDDGNRVWLQSSSSSSLFAVLDGTPIAPFAATGPRQFARKRRMPFNSTLTLDVWEWCLSVQGNPTRNRLIDGKLGRGNESVFIPQLRRQTAGWDGCRELRWIRPSSRSGHKGVLIEKFNRIVVYGGLSYKDVDNAAGIHPSTDAMNETFDTIVVDDMWTYGIDSCPRDCSSQGLCTDGFCQCDTGFYGLDCSNITCPGSLCYYDDDHVQHCEHCCFDGFDHDSTDVDYVSGIGKSPCKTLEEGGFTGHSNGVCDGFGSCQCAPPFLGEDCSIRDCPDNCNDNGYCSLEFPMSRCICNDGYKGNACQHIECMNNCSYPNGECDYSTGACECNALRSPYNLSHIYAYWEGVDCSFLTPWCGSSRMQQGVAIAVIFLITAVVLI